VDIPLSTPVMLKLNSGWFHANNSSNYQSRQLIAAAMIHSFGVHYLWAIISPDSNLQCLTDLIDATGTSPFSPPELQGLPTMFPVLFDSEQETLGF